MNPLVSIIVPLYNQERYLDACLRSISRQSYKNLEVIVVNDGSTDNSSSMAKEWIKKDQRIRVVDKCNEGATKARLYGFGLANGDYVAFVDSDDLLPEDSISILANEMKEKNVDLVIGSITKKLGFFKKRHIDRCFSFPYNQVVSQPELFDKYYLGFFKNDILPVSMCARLYRKSVIDHALQETSLYDNEITLMGEDQFFNVKLFPYLHSVYRIDKTVYIYRFGGGTTYFNPRFTQLFALSDKRLKLLDQYHYDEGYFSYEEMGFGDVIDNEEDLVEKIIEYMESKGYVLSDEDGENLSFRLSSPFGKMTRIWEDTISFTRELGGFSVEGITRDIVRIVSGLQYKLRGNED